MEDLIILNAAFNHFKGSHTKLKKALAQPQGIQGLDLSREALVQSQTQIEKLETTGGWILRPEDPQFPRELRSSRYCPQILFGVGKTEFLNYPSIAIIGTRKPQDSTVSCLRQWFSQVQNTHFCTISGMAIGCDFFAHQYSLDNGIPTQAILGQGLLHPLSGLQKTMAKKIVKHGSVVSAFPLGSPANKSTFPIRNQWISGASKSLVLCESLARGGSLITVNFCQREGKTIYCIPQHPSSPWFPAFKHLIEKGARVVTSLDSLLESEIPQITQPRHKKSPKPIFKQAKTFNQIFTDKDFGNLSEADLLAKLTQLELFGTIARNPQGHYYSCTR